MLPSINWVNSSFNIFGKNPQGKIILHKTLNHAQFISFSTQFLYMPNTPNGRKIYNVLWPPPLSIELDIDRTE